MSGRHTEGRLRALPGGYLANEVDGTLVDGFVATALHDSDCRRLAACWNACIGMPTDDVEELAKCEGVMTLTVYADDQRQQLDGARTLLEQVRDENDAWLASARAAGTFIDENPLLERIRMFLDGGGA